MSRLRAPQRAALAQRRRRRSRKYLATALLIILAGFGAASARLFVWSPQGMPSRVDAIFMLNGSGNRLNTALGLAWAHRAPMIAISRGSRYSGHGSVCAPKIPRVKVICFDPDPPTTRGEAEFAGLLAKRYHWHSVVLVATSCASQAARRREALTRRP